MSLHRDFAHLQIPLKEILSATNNFDDKYIIGQGGFGKVYKGQLCLSGSLIDIVARRLDPEFGQGDRQFWSEISMLYNLRHTNLVSIIGFCDENGEKIIINEFQINLSLDEHLSDSRLTWTQRLRICVGVAYALSFIHYEVGRDFSVIHRNIKSSKILLDDNWEPKLSGFSLSMTNIESERHGLSETDICGTPGYVDPTYLDTGTVSHKSDVYSFGVVLFEVLCGRDAYIKDNENRDLAQLAILHYQESKLDDLIDPGLRKQMDPRSFDIFSETANMCLMAKRSQRPHIDEIVKRLEKALEFQLENENPQSFVTTEVEGTSSSHLKMRNFEHLKIPLSDILMATHNFSSEFCIGAGGFGRVYKVELDHFDIEGANMDDHYYMSRSTVALKRMISRKDNEGEQGFFAEIELLAGCKHPNILSLVGFCIESSERILVYEYATNGSLEDLLSRAKYMPNITWDQRIQICIDIALGLNYLHSVTEDKKRIIHRDIKSANVLLDDKWKAKIADFGLAVSQSDNSKAGTSNSNVMSFDSTINTNTIAGTFMYLDPEYQKTGKLKRESDIYSFGVLLFEVLCGRLAYDQIYMAENKDGLASIARKRFKEGRLKEMVDPKLKEVDGNNFQQNNVFNQESLDTFSKIAYQCLAETQAGRPTMEVVIKELEKAYFLTIGEFAHLQIPLQEIVFATNNFNAENLTHCDFGKAYKGQILRSGERIDIVARRLDFTKAQDVEFWTEISMLSSLNNRNIVSIAGFCFENGEKIIVYKLAVHGSLDEHLSDPTLSWFKRLQICLGVARALSYIHYDVIHCDIKSTKIFLDKDWDVKLFGFELSTKYPENWRHRLLFSRQFKRSAYTDPVYLSTGSMTPKYDVYSFGVILFEVLCGRKATLGVGDGVEKQSLIEMVTRLYAEGKLDEMIDPNLRKDMDSQSLTIFVKIAYNCLKERVQRHTMDQVVLEIEDALELQWKHENLGQSTFGDEPAISSTSLRAAKLKMERLRIPLSEIKKATNDFDSTNFAGSGGFADVYKAELEFLDDAKSLSSVEGENKIEPRKRTVAIKRIKKRDEQIKQGFLMEIELLNSCQHRNIVSLLGYCREENEMILVFEYAFKGSLGDHLARDSVESTSLTWVQRLNICLDVARGLNYLHSNMEGKPRIIHRDMKSDNILLDEDLNALIADFGLSKFHPKNQQASTILGKSLAGTEVYVDPEYSNTFRYKKETDIYSFGVVLFEILSGSLAYDPIYTRVNVKGLAPIARRRYIEGTLKELLDPKIIEEDEKDVFTLNRGPNQKSFDAFSKIAYQCLAETQAKRPTIEVIITELQNALKLQGETLVLSRFQLSDIESAIKEACSIGSDAYGIVYKAKLYHFNSSLKIKGENCQFPMRPINAAIKRIYSGEDGQGEEQFYEEIEMLTSYKHPNIVTLLGFCDNGPEMFLVFEYGSNGNLDKYLTRKDTNLTWAQRLHKCLDIARGLNHLHTKMDDVERIIHGDINSANILLGNHLEAKIAYFGLSQSHPSNQDKNSTLVTKNNVDTTVYWDPEYTKTGKLKKESDIYSFGVVLFEIFCGRLAYDSAYIAENENGLAPIARRCVNDGTIGKMIDPKLKIEADEDFISNRGPNQDSLAAFLKIANECLGETQVERPTMSIVIQELEMALNFQENLMNNLQLSLEDIETTTEKFSEKNCITRGRYWKAYKGQISLPKAQVNANAKPISNEQTIVVAKRWDSTYAQRDLHFMKELEILFRYKNEHIIGLAGYCNETNEKIIVMESASNESLDKYLNDVTLTWMKRLKICIDVASGLEFLHEGATTLKKVVHGGIKTSCILLDGDWKAKISNFELSMDHASDNNVYGTFGHIYPEHEQGVLTEKSDIYAFGVVLFETLCGRLAWVEGCQVHSQSLGPLAKSRYYEEGNIDEMVFEGIKDKIVPQSLETFVEIAYQCLHDDRDERPQASEVVKLLKNALEFQEDIEIWEHKLPGNYKKILAMADIDIDSIVMKKDIHEKLTDGILIEEGKGWFSLSSTGEGKILISATTFSYENHRLHKWRSIQKSIARFHTVAKMMDVSNLKIEIKTNTNFLSPGISYGVHLVFKFCDPRKVLSKLMYINLRYKIGSETLHTYFATQRNDDEWMMVELWRILYHKEEDTNFEVILESFSQYYCGCGAIYVQGIEFQAIDNKKHEEMDKTKGVQQVPKLKLDMDQVQGETLKASGQNNEQETLFSIWEVNGKKYLKLSAREVLYNSHKLNTFGDLRPSAESRFDYVMEVLPRQVIRIKYKIEIEKLSPFTEYVCYLVFKLKKKCRGLHCPVKVRDLLDRKNKETKTVYFRSPATVNQHKDIWVPEQRKDGWTEVMVWKFNSKYKLRKNHIPLNLKLITYQGTMSGLIICGLEFRPK